MEKDSGSRAIATTNGNSNMVLAIMHRRPPGRFGHVLLDGLADFGVAMLIGAEPAVYLIARAVSGCDFAGREANWNTFVTRGMPAAEQRARYLQYLRSLGYDTD